MDSTSTYYAVGLISLIVATLLFIMYINVINMDLATDEKAEDTPDQESSVQYVLMDREKGNRHHRKSNDDTRDYDWDYNKKHEKYTYANKDDDPNNPYNDAYSAETIAMRQEQIKKQGDFMKKHKKNAEGFLPAANDLTVKRKLQTGAENIRNTNLM